MERIQAEEGRLVHLGGGKTARMDQPDFIDRSIAIPKAKQRLTLRGRHIRPVAQVIPLERARKPVYGPCAFLKLPKDGCRYSLPSGLFCGSKAWNGTPWCCEHHGEVYLNSPFRQVKEAAE